MCSMYMMCGEGGGQGGGDGGSGGVEGGGVVCYGGGQEKNHFN